MHEMTITLMRLVKEIQLGGAGERSTRGDAAEVWVPSHTIKSRTARLNDPAVTPASLTKVGATL